MTDWQPLTMDMRKLPDGSVSGVLTLGLFQFHLRGWHKDASGILRAEYAPKLDGEWMAEMTRRGIIK
jgi:hypothetical protein